MSFPVPANEVERLAALERLGIVGTGSEPIFDHIVRLVARITGTPVALITLVTRDAQWFKANVGLDGLDSTPREVAFCAHAVASGELLVVQDALRDPRFAANPIVTDAPGIRFYAGAPLVTRAGHALGTLCAIDHVPRDLAREQLATLQELAAIVTALIEARADRDQLAVARAALARRERDLRTITDQVPAMIGYSDRSGRLRYANRHLRAMSGSADVRDRPVREVIGEELYVVAEPWLERAYAGETVTYEREAIIDGVTRHQEVTYVPDLAGDGSVRGIYSLTYDVTERVQHRAAVHASEARLRGVIAAMAEGLVVQDRDGRIVDANAAAEAMLGLRREEFLGRTFGAQPWRTIRDDGSPFPPDQFPAMVTLRTGRPQWNEIMGVHCAHGLRWISINSQPVAGGEAPGAPAVVTTLADVTDERLAFDRIRALVQRLETVRDDERRSVAQLLHEGIAQDLFAMQLMLKPYAEPGPGREQVAQLYEAVNASLGKCMAQLREIANLLHPTALQHQGLADAIGSYARYFSELSGLRVQVQERGTLPRLTEPQRVLFFRAAQEGLANIARHAAAEAVTISLQVDGTTVAMEVCDDGVGIDESAPPKPGSLGLLALNERFHAIGGGVRLSRNPISGSTLRVHAPLAA